MSDSSKFAFCPRCGAVTQDGQCRSCGYRESQPEADIRGCYSGGGPNPYQSSYQNMYPDGYPNLYPFPPVSQAPQKKNGGAAVVIAVLAAVLVIAVFGVSFATFYSLGRGGQGDPRDYSWFVGDDKVDRDKDQDTDQDTDRDKNWWEDDRDSETEREEENTDPADGEYYGELYSALRYDLDYRIDMEDGYFSPQEYENVEVSISYPQISGDVANLDYLNEILEYEYQYYLEYFTYEYEPDMDRDSYYICKADCYITYMDENVMSVVFREEVLLDWLSAINFYCLNFNMKDGVLMNNTELLQMDQEFALDFRKREARENGDNWLTDYSDQEILQLLKDPDYLVIFYTPMGMAVGLNLQEVVVYVTYTDYEKYQGSY